jgi:hypothetical protein
LVLASRNGRFVALDLETGKPLGGGYALKASAMPVASPAPFAPGVAFAPLSDGTVMLLPLEALRDRN